MVRWQLHTYQLVVGKIQLDMAVLCVRPPAHERVDVVAARKEYVEWLLEQAHRIIQADPTDAVLELLRQPYDKVFSKEEQDLLGVTLRTSPEGKQERPLLVRLPQPPQLCCRRV